MRVRRSSSSRPWQAAPRTHLPASPRGSRPAVFARIAPAAPMRTFDNAFFFSDRVDPASLRYQLANGNWDIGALALK